MVVDGNSVRELQLKAAAVTERRDESYDVATDATKKPKTAGADVALPSSLLEAPSEEVDSQMTNTAEL